MTGGRLRLRAAYISPLSNSVNRISAIMVGDLRALGLPVGPITDALLRDWRVPRRAKVSFLNWFEDRLAASPRPLLEFVRSALVLILLKIRVKHIVWVRHNESPHAGRDMPYLYPILLKLLGRASSATVSFRPSRLAQYVVPHPGYRSAMQRIMSSGQRKNHFLLFGSVRPNKGYLELLRCWPPGRRLVILGSCADEQLSEQIRAVIRERGLAALWHERFVPDEELNAWLSEARYAIVTHREGTSIVSGTFYHAASFGVNVLVSPGDFLAHLQMYYSFVNPLVEGSSKRCNYIEPEDVVAEFETINGDQPRQAAWMHIFDELDLDVPNPVRGAPPFSHRGKRLDN